jgi:proteasome lid subunit RPN8/RPN11
MQTISLTTAQIEELISIAKHALPNESCAFLLGKDETVVEVLPMRNGDNSPITFSIDPEDILSSYNLAEKKQVDVIAIFHSHPAKPSPSETDRKFMEINPVIWLIYSTTEGQLNAFIYDDEVKQVGIRIVDSRG